MYPSYDGAGLLRLCLRRRRRTESVVATRTPAAFEQAEEAVLLAAGRTRHARIDRHRQFPGLQSGRLGQPRELPLGDRLRPAEQPVHGVGDGALVDRLRLPPGVHARTLPEMRADGAVRDELLVETLHVDAGTRQSVPGLRARRVAHVVVGQQPVDVRRLVVQKLHPGRPHRRREHLAVEEAFEVTEAVAARPPSTDQPFGQRRQSPTGADVVDLAAVAVVPVALGHRRKAYAGRSDKFADRAKA